MHFAQHYKTFRRKMTDLMPNIASVTDLQRDYKRLTDLAKSTGQPVILLKKNKPEAVLCDYKTYQRNQKKQEELELAEVMAAIESGEKEYAAGKAKELKGSLVDLIK
jgi:PHD/YefM family antitoxin component YafN of YafNO toxin-antitoxin module